MCYEWTKGGMDGRGLTIGWTEEWTNPLFLIATLGYDGIRGRRMSKKKFGIEFRILWILLTEFRISNTEFRISNTECLSTGRIKKLVWIHLKTGWLSDDLLKILHKRKYMSRISYTPYRLLFNTALLDETKIVRNSMIRWTAGRTGVWTRPLIAMQGRILLGMKRLTYIFISSTKEESEATDIPEKPFVCVSRQWWITTG